MSQITCYTGRCTPFFFYYAVLAISANAIVWLNTSTTFRGFVLVKVVKLAHVPLIMVLCTITGCSKRSGQDKDVSIYKGYH